MTGKENKKTITVRVSADCQRRLVALYEAKKDTPDERSQGEIVEIALKSLLDFAESTEWIPDECEIYPSEKELERIRVRSAFATDARSRLASLKPKADAPSKKETK